MFFQEGRSKISMFLVFALLFSMLVPAMASGAETVQLKDISDSYAQTEIQDLVGDGVISGYEDGSFQPDKAMSRAELAKIIVLSLGLKENADKTSAFTDVDKNGWYNGFVGALVESGITQGTSATTFSPEAKVTREELVVFFIRAMGLEEAAGKIPADAKLSDLNEVSSWAQAHVSLAYKVGFINGIDSNDGTLKFSPKASAERQALARLAYEFKNNKSKFVEKANELVNTGLLVNSSELVISNVSVVNNSSVEVTFNEEITAVDAADFTFDNGLNVTKAELKAESKTVVVLTTTVQTPGSVYNLSYKGKNTGKSVTGFAAAISGGGGGRKSNTQTASDLSKINSGGTYESLRITSQGTVGPVDGAGKTTVTGTLILDPGAEGEIMLQNVDAANIVVASGSSNSIKLRNTIIKTLRVAATNQTKPVRIESLSGSEVTNTDVQSKVIIESSAGSLGMIKIGSGANGQEVELRGTIKGAVTVEGEGAQIKLAAPKDGGTTNVATLNVGANATISAGTGTSLGAISITAPNTTIALSGEGEIQSVTVSKEAEGTTLNLTSINVSAIQLNANIKLEGDAAVIGAVPITATPGVVVEASQSLISTLKDKAIAAIAAIGVFNKYSAEVDSGIIAAETLANNAIVLGVAKADIPGYSTKLAEAKRAITQFALEAAYQDLKIGFAEKDSKDAVTQNVLLPATDAKRNVSIKWKTSNSAFVSGNGVVTRPAVGEANAEVVLTATMSKYGQERDVDFTITVLAQTPTGPSEPTEPTLVSLSSEQNSVVLNTYNNATQQLKIIATYSNGIFSDVTKDALYSSSVPAIATVSKAGTVMALAKGTSDITVSYGGKTAIVSVTVTAGGPNPQPLEAPTVWVTSGDAQVKLYWNSVGTSVTYQVYGSMVSGSYKTLPTTVTGTTYTASGLENGTQYFFIVKAVKDGVSATSNEVSVTPTTANTMEKTRIPTVTGSVYTNGFMLSGYAEPGLNYMKTNTTLTKSDGTQVAGSGGGGGTKYPWTNVTLSKQDGTLIAETGVNYDGTFTLQSHHSYSPIVSLSVGEELLLTAQAYGKSKSDPVRFIVKATNGQTAIPTVIGTVYEDSTVSGRAEPGAFVIMRLGTNTSATVSSSYDGSYYLHTPTGALKAGDDISITATMLGKTTSNPLIVTVQSSPKTAAPTVTGNVYTNGYMLSGSAESSSMSSYTSVTLSKSDGTYVAGTGVYYEGKFTLQSSYSVTFSAGEELFLTAQAYGKKKSDPVSITVKATSGQTATPTVTGTVYELNSSISGKAEPGALVNIRSSTTNGYNTTVTASTYDGSYSNWIPTLSVGDQLTVTAITLGKATSNPMIVTVKSSPKTAIPTVTGNVYTNGYMLSGSAESSSMSYYTSITLSKSDGTYVAGTSVYYEGKFTLQSSYNYSNVTLTAGEELFLTAQAYGKKKSDPVKFVVQATGVQTAAVMSDNVTDALISGWAEFGATVIIKADATGRNTTVYASSTNGYFSLNPTGIFKVGDQLTITAFVIGQATSEAIHVTVEASPTTETPTVTGNVYTNAFFLSGKAEPGSMNNWTSVTLEKQDGTSIAGGSTMMDGNFTIQSNYQVLLAPLSVGEKVQVRAQASGKKKSDPVYFIVQATSGRTEIPTITTSTETIVSGWAEPGSYVTVKVGVNGNPFTTMASTYDGTYNVSIMPPGSALVGDQVTVTAITLGKATSDPAYSIVQVSQKTEAPTVTGIVYTNAFIIKGAAESGSVINLATKSGAYVGTAHAGPDGTFSTTQLTNTYTTIAVGEELLVTAQVYNKKKSDPVQLVVHATNGKTDVPDINDDVYETNRFSGTAEPGAIVLLRNDSRNYRNETIASSNGEYNFYYSPDLFREGDQLTLTATFPGKETSDTVNITLVASP